MRNPWAHLYSARRPLGMAVAAALLAQPAWAQEDAAGEASLTTALQGRTAGEPVDCITLRNIRAVQVIDRTALIYDMIDGTRYVNRPRSGAAALNQFDLLVSDTRSTQLCNVDVVRLVDRSTNNPTGFVNLGDFVPYRRDAAGSTDQTQSLPAATDASRPAGS